MRKNLIYLFILFLTGLKASGQGLYDAPIEEKKQFVFTPNFFIGPSVGRNNISGMLGALAELHIYKNISVVGGAGMDNWGGCFSGQIRYYRKYPLRFFYGVGFSSYTGLKDTKIKLKVEGLDDPTEVEMDLHKINCIRLSFGHHFKLGKRMRVNFELGYEIPLTTDFYTIKDPTIALTKDSENTMDFMKPSGLILGAAFSIGL
jgi:hypothetical protein